MLRTLGFRIPAAHLDSLLGQVAAYPWDTTFAEAWQRLPRKTRKGGRPVGPPYRQLLTGLTAVHNHPVRIVDEWGLSQDDKDNDIKGMIVASGPIDPFHLTTCVRTFEKLLRNGEDLNTLAPLLPTADTTRRFRDHVAASDSGTATGPGWLFDSAVWSVMARLATRSLRLEDNGPALPLRMDTDGSLVVWDDLVANPWGARTGYAMLRITARIATLPRIPDLAIVFDAHLSRINDQWRGSKTTWIDRDNPALPILRVPVRNVPPAEKDGRWTTEVANHAAAIARACGMEGLDLDQDLPTEPGAVRPLVPGPRIHPVGKGPGARIMLRLAEHIEATCPELQRLPWLRDRHTKITTPRRQVLGDPGQKTEKTTLPVTADVIRAAASAAGNGRIRLLCLYSSSAARDRMATQLRALSPAAVPNRDDQTAEVNTGLAVSFHHVKELLRHGTHDRADLLTDIQDIAKQETGTLLAWVETVYDPRTGKPEDDAKNPVRRILAQLGIAAQFLATPPDDTRPADTDPATPPARRRRRRSDDSGKTKTDHAAINAAADLMLRTAGVLHPEMTSDILQDFLADTPHTHVHLAGLHSRLQQSGIDGVPPRLVLTATSLHAHTDPVRPWTVTTWSDTAKNWISQPRGIADFHAGRIGSLDHGRRGDKGVATRLYAEAVLDTLPPGPVVLFVDALATRSIWPGLQNHQFGAAAMPAVNLTTNRDVAIVRCNTSREVPRPVDRQGGHRPRNDHRQPAAPDRYVYRLADSNVWLFPKSSRVYRAKGGRLGANYTPWTLPEDLRFLLKDDWHSYTGTEIAVPQPGPWNERALVTLTARLCDHTITWDDRTLAPMPLHLATRADLTHPDYRTDDEDGAA